MKSLILRILVLAIGILTLISCSGDDSGNTTPDKIVLIKKITEVLIEDEMELTTDFTYENNVLISTTEGNYRSEFTYNGNKIVLIKYFNNNIPTGQTTIAYNGNLLDYTLSGENADEKTQYHYTNGVLSKIESGYIANNNEFIVLETEQILFDGSNIGEVGYHANFGNGPFSYKHKFTYDTKNAPTKFMNKYLRLLLNTAGFRGINDNNNLTRQYLSTTDNTILSTHTFGIVYNQDDYPTEIKEYSAENTLRTITTIEYQ